MPQRCSICSRPDVGAINGLLGEGRSARSVAIELGLSEDALQRHAVRHGAKVRNARKKPEAETVRRRTVSADPLDELVDALREQALAGNPAIVHQYRLALAAQADAQHSTAPKRALADEPEWIALRTQVLAALEPFPDARAAINTAIDEMGA